MTTATERSTIAYSIAAPSAEFVLLTAGRHVKNGRPIEVTEADLDAAVRNFAEDEAVGYAPPFDFDHSFAMGKGSKASGWIRALRRVGRDLLARVEWTPAAAAAIERGEYRFASAEFSKDAKREDGSRRGFAILGAALTNRPFLRALGGVALSADDRTAELELLVSEVEDLAERDDVDRESFAVHRTAVGLMVADRTLTYREAVEAAGREHR